MRKFWILLLVLGSFFGCSSNPEEYKYTWHSSRVTWKEGVVEASYDPETEIALLEEKDDAGKWRAMSSDSIGYVGGTLYMGYRPGESRITVLDKKSHKVKKVYEE